MPGADHGASNKFDPDEQLDQVALYWINVCEAEPGPLTIRVLGKDRDVRLDIAGGSRIPKYAGRDAETAQILAELRASWHGVEKLLLAYDGSPLSVDFLDTVLSFLDPAIAVTLIDIAETRSGPSTASLDPRRGGGTGGHPAGRRARPRAGPRGRLPGGPGRARPVDRADGPRRQVRRHLPEPARRLPRARHRRHAPAPPATCSSTPPAA